MHEIQFDTIISDGRTERGELHEHEHGQILRTGHENRPDFVLHDDGRVDLVSANRPDIVIDGFGENGVLRE